MKRQPGHVPGLKFIPTLEPEISDQADCVLDLMGTKSVSEEFSERNRAVLTELLDNFPGCRTILEIGVMRTGPASSTAVLQAAKRRDTVYLGVDIADRLDVHDPDRNCFFFRCDSRWHDAVMRQLHILGHALIDLLLIDGCHSVEMVVNDWKYTQWLSPQGVVVIHDTSVHPGPYAVFAAIDEDLYHKQKLFAERSDDWGLAVIRRR